MPLPNHQSQILSCVTNGSSCPGSPYLGLLQQNSQIMHGQRKAIPQAPEVQQSRDQQPEANLDAQVKLCLVINKVDRLIQELHLTPAEAYERLKAIVAHANMVVSSFQSEQFLTDADALLAHEAALASGAGGRYESRQHGLFHVHACMCICCILAERWKLHG